MYTAPAADEELVEVNVTVPLAPVFVNEVTILLLVTFNVPVAAMEYP